MNIEETIASAEYHIRRLYREAEIKEIELMQERGRLNRELRKYIKERNGEPLGTMPKQRKRSILS